MEHYPQSSAGKGCKNGLANMQMCNCGESLLDKRLAVGIQGICKDIVIPCGGLYPLPFPSCLYAGWLGDGEERKGKERKGDLWGVHLTSAGSLEKGPAGSSVALNPGKGPAGCKELLQGL